MNNTEEALNKKGVIIDRWILRLGKSDEEAGKFTPWFLPSNTLKEDYAAFLACLSLTRLVSTVEERMKGQKSTIRAVKKEQRETAKMLKKEQEKLQKALDKAAAKIAKEDEKQRIKAEAKAERERLKLMGKVKAPKAEDLPEGIQPRIDDVEFIGGAPCTSTSNAQTKDTPTTVNLLTPSEARIKEPVPTLLDITPLPTKCAMVSLQEPNSSLNQNTVVPETPQPVVTILTAAQGHQLPVEKDMTPLPYQLPME